MPALSTTYSQPISSRATETGMVFFVEDEDYIADMMVVIFERAGLRAVRARDGAEALRMVTEISGEIALAMVDLCLPDIGGDELCRQLRALRPGLPVLLTSGRDKETLLQELESGGPTGWISKPYRPAELVKQVRAMLPHAA